ncbi:uncharacterized protein V1510DRAFT_413712 [Dipodascopsis tothii]|uniref:uncharacterized protein n=1 Tax=Dipodascopsis tothii TaxID=44089 RepID=UPI0034CFC019
MSKQLVRSIKNVTNGYTSSQVKVRNATSNDPWGPSGTDMNEIALMTFDNSTLFEIMEMIDKRLNDKGKNWRHVMKALMLLDYCIHAGSENVVLWSKDNIYIVKTLREFQYIDEEGRDQGANVRSKAKDLTALLQDDERLRAERANRNHMRDKMGRPGDDMEGYRERPDRAERSARRRPTSARDGDDDDEMRRAIEESKATAQEEEEYRRSHAEEPDDDLAKALRLSREEEERRRREQEQSNSSLLYEQFAPAPAAPTDFMYQQQTGYPQQFQQGYYNPMQQQAMPTGFLQNAYASPYGFDMSQQQQQQQQPQQPQQPMPTGSNNPFAQFSSPKPAGSPSLSNKASLSQLRAQQPPAPVAAQPTGADAPFAKLNALLATGEGIDTFGNSGELRVPAQHSTTGFVNSYGIGQRTGTATNPFMAGQGSQSNLATQPTGYGFQQPAPTGSVTQPAFGLQQQPQQQPQALAPQATGFLQAQPTGYNPYQAQQLTPQMTGYPQQQSYQQSYQQPQQQYQPQQQTHQNDADLINL